MISKVKDVHCGYNLTQEQSKWLNVLTRREFLKPVHLRTTPYLLLKRVRLIAL